VSERDEEVLRRWGTKDPVQEGWYTCSKRRHRSGTGIGQSLMRISRGWRAGNPASRVGRGGLARGRNRNSDFGKIEADRG
jgi:hypothetical protein